MKIGIITLATGEKFIRDIKYGRKTLENYCTLHGYNLLEDLSLVDIHDREIQWTKIPLILKYLSISPDEYDYLVWIDADTIIMNQTIKVETIMDRLMGDKLIMYSKDFGNWINNGVIFIKNDPMVVDFFTETWNHPNEICREQGAMDKLYRMNWKGCRNIIQVTDDPCEYNPVWFQYKPDQFLMHFPGCGEPCRKPNSLLYMMDMFMPLKMNGDDEHFKDTDGTHSQRLQWLSNYAEADVRQLKARCDAQGFKYLPNELN